MWVFCCGPVRSGSTLHFNITREIVEKTNTGKTIAYVYTENFPAVYEENKDDECFKIFKTHALTTLMKDLIKEKKACAIYCYRDIRDVVVSTEHKAGREIKPKNNYSQFTKRYLKYYNEVKELPHIYISRYEDFYDNLASEIRSIASFLDVSITEEVVLDISERLHFKNSKEYIKQVDKTEFIGKQGQKFLLDKKTMLHDNHFRHIVPGAYKKCLSRENLTSIECISYNWLISNNYNLSPFRYLKYKIKEWIK